MCFRARFGNQSIDFSDFWYKTSLVYHFEYGIDSSARKEKLGKNGEKGVANMHIRAFLGNRPLDFSDFRYETSLIYFFKYDTGSFARKNMCGPKTPKTPYKLTGYITISNTKLTLNFELCLFGNSTK